MTGKITLISPPDIYVNKSFSIILVNTTDDEEAAITDWFSGQHLGKEVSIYFYNGDNSIQWLMTAFSIAKHKYINVERTIQLERDNSKHLLSYLLSCDDCYYTLENEDLFEIYKLLNTSRIDSVTEFLNRVIPIEHEQTSEL